MQNRFQVFLISLILSLTFPYLVTADVGTDLDLGGTTENDRLYWLFDSEIFEGMCEEGKPLLRDHCSKSIRRVGQKNFKEGVLKETKGALMSAESELALPKKNFEIANGKLQDFDETSQERFQVKGEIVQLKLDLTNLTTKKVHLSNELSKVEEALAIRPSEELRIKREILLGDLKKVQEELTAKSKQVADKSDRLAVLEKKLEGFEQRDLLQQKVESAKVPYLEAKAKYDRALEIYNIADDSIQKVEQEIVYEILSSDQEYFKNRSSVRLFKDVFDRIRLAFQAGDYSENYGHSDECVHNLEVINGSTISLRFSGTDRRCKAASPVTLRCTSFRCKGSGGSIKSIELLKLNGTMMYQCNVLFNDGASSSSTYSERD